MELFRNIRLRMGRSSLARKLVKRHRDIKYKQLNNVKSIGIVWDASNVSDFNGLSSFHHRMHEMGIEVTIIGFYPENELPNQYTAIRYLTCLKKNELNSYFQPVSAEAVNFMNSKFDLLIDLNFKNIFPLYYLSALSLAQFKVGLLDSAGIFDLMMDIKNPQDLGVYLNHVIHYLEMIKSTEA